MDSHNIESWLMVSISSFACILGASIVLFGGHVIESQQFLSSSMAMGGGVLLFNSLYTLLPTAYQKLDQSDLVTFFWFFAGVFLTASLSRLIQHLTPHALHTCEPSKRLYSRQISDTEYGSMTVHDEPSDKADYFLIGIQTAMAICLHKFPEGLIMFISNSSSSKLGTSVAAAIGIHNCIEGCLISLPLYYATQSRLAAFSYASLLGGLSQPLGALIGLMIIDPQNPIEERYGIIFSIVSGMMCYVAIRSMIPQAVRADKLQHATSFFFAGIFLVAFTCLLHSN